MGIMIVEVKKCDFDCFLKVVYIGNIIKKNIVWFKYRVIFVVKLFEKMYWSVRIDRRDIFCLFFGMRYNKFNIYFSVMYEWWIKYW